MVCAVCSANLILNMCCRPQNYRGTFSGCWHLFVFVVIHKHRQDLLLISAQKSACSGPWWPSMFGHTALVVDILGKANFVACHTAEHVWACSSCGGRVDDSKFYRLLMLLNMILLLSLFIVAGISRHVILCSRLAGFWGGVFTWPGTRKKRRNVMITWRRYLKVFRRGLAQMSDTQAGRRDVDGSGQRDTWWWRWRGGWDGQCASTAEIQCL